MTTKTNHDQQVPVEGLPGAFVTKDSIALYDVAREIQRIRSIHGPLASTHEGLGVLLEEFDELKDEIKKPPRTFRSDLMRTEAIQVAAVATRIASDLAHDDTKVRPRIVLMRDQAEAKCDQMRDRALAAEALLKEHRRVATLFVLSQVKLGSLHETKPGSVELKEAFAETMAHGATLMDLLGILPEGILPEEDES